MIVMLELLLMCNGFKNDQEEGGKGITNDKIEGNAVTSGVKMTIK